MTGRPIDPFQAGFGATLRAGSTVEHAANAPGWSLEFEQLGRGAFTGTLSMALSVEAQFGVNEFTPGLQVRGQAPPGTVIVGVTLGATSSARWRGAEINDSHVLVAWPETEIDLRMFRPAAILTATMQPGRVRAYLDAIFGGSLDTVCNRLGTDLSQQQRRAQLERIGLDEVLRSPQRLADPVIARQFEEKVLHALCVGVRLPVAIGRESGSAALARRAEEFLRAQLTRPITIRDLCLATGASERTLHDAFRRHLGTTPKAYLKQIRLNAVHRELEQGAPRSTVTEVAMRWGFFHPGWFAHDYRRTFHRTPSETLRAARGGAAVLG